MSKGYPTPDNPLGDVTFSCIPVYVPSNPEFEGIFAAAIYGLYSEMSKEYFWRDFGTMPAAEAAFLAARGLAASQAYDGDCGGGSELTCEQIADCIETDDAVKDAITESIVSDGFAPKPETDLSVAPPPTLTTAATAENLVPSIVDCVEQPQIAMGLARAIVTEIHQSVEDFLELIEYATNAAEGLAMAAEQVPLFGTAISGALEFMDWVLETWGETYLAAYNQSVEDELACAIFCHIMEDCTLSIDALLAIYEDKGSITVPPPNDLEAVLTFAIDTPFSPDTVCVAMFHYTVLRFMAWGSLGGFSATYLKSLLAHNVSASDYSYEDLCEDCVEADPTDYWALVMDFRQGSQHGTETVIVNGGGHDGRWTGTGYEANLGNVASTTNENLGLADLGGDFVIRASAATVTHMGGDSNGSHDFVAIWAFPNANYGGSGGNFFGLGGVGNGVSVDVGVIAPSAVSTFRSMQVRHRVNIATNSETPHKSRTFRWAIWGLAGAGNTKPRGAIWAGNTLPSTIPELFTP